jgi:predicted metalloendopeptidase
MRLRLTFACLVAAVVGAAAAAHDIDVAGMNRSVHPGDDFFAYTNGRWLERTEIPADRGTAGIWADLAEQATSHTREILEHAAASSAPAGSDERKIGDFYAAYMDEAAIEAKGLAPLAPFLEKISAIGDRRALSAYVCSTLRADVDALNATNFYTPHLFGLWFTQDLNDPARTTAYMLQGGLGMPDRDYYLDSAKEMAEARAAYKAHVAATLRLARVDDADGKAEAIVALEHDIASAHATRTESVDVAKANNPWTREEFASRAPGIDWPACFAAARLEAAPRIIVWHPRAVTGIAALVGTAPIEVWRSYLAFHLVDEYGGVLPKAFVDERFAFYGKTLSGTPRMRDRWKRAVDATDAALGDAVGRLYVQRHFPPEAKARLQAIVKTIVTAFEHRIDALTWMDAKTKAGAKAKLSTLIVGIGYPDKWRDYSTLQVVRGEALMNRWRAELRDYETERAKLGRAPDRGEWWMTPQTVNAVNLPIQNALNFPAAILQPPFYDPQADAPVIYGAIGTVIGHEISHSFDDQGSQFDANGRLRSWWTESDFAHFKEASAKLVAQYNAYTPLPNLHVNGQLTLSENIADVAGLSAAYDAYKASPEARRQSTAADGFTNDQRLFISFGQNWRSKMREPLLRQVIVTDGHAPDEYRADTVRNLDPWYGAFDVKPGQRLYLEPPDRVRVW